MTVITEILPKFEFGFYQKHIDGTKIIACIIFDISWNNKTGKKMLSIGIPYIFNIGFGIEPKFRYNVITHKWEMMKN